MTWLVDFAYDHIMGTVILSNVLMFAVGVALGIAYSHGSEEREIRRLAKAKKTPKANLGKAWRR